MTQPAKADAGAKFLLERENVDGQCVQTDILMPIRSPVPGSEQARIDGIFPVEDGMTARIAHDVQQQQTCGGVGMLERVHRQAVAGAFVRRQSLVIGSLVPDLAISRIERPKMDMECKADRVAAQGVVRFVPAEEPVVLRCDPAKVIDDLPISDQGGDFLKVFQ
jgi:hypothetical protein